MLSTLQRPALLKALFMTCTLLASGASRAEEVLLDFGPVVTQPDSVTCGPTCGAMVLGYYGIEAGVQPLATECGTTVLEGLGIAMTLPEGLQRGVGQYGLTLEKRKATVQDIPSVIRTGRPVILLVRSGRKTWHYIVVTGFRDTPLAFRIHDPSGHVYWATAENIAAIWAFSNGMMPISDDWRKWLETEYIPDDVCGSCGGSGNWTGPDVDLWCPACKGSGRWKIIVDLPLGRSYEKDLGDCKVCKGAGRWREGGIRTDCPVCGGSGTCGDVFRKAVEMVASGNTMFVPTKSPNLTEAGRAAPLRSQLTPVPDKPSQATPGQPNPTPSGNAPQEGVRSPSSDCNSVPCCCCSSRDHRGSRRGILKRLFAP